MNLELEAALSDNKVKIDLINQVVSLNILKSPENEAQIRVVYQPRLDFFNSRAQSQVYINFTSDSWGHFVVYTNLKIK